jgi:hypothetical protein
MTGNVFDEGGDALHRHGFDAVHAPGHFGNVHGRFAVDIFIEHRLEFGATLLPLLRSRHPGSVLHDQDLGQFGIRVGFGLIVIGVARFADVIGTRGRLHFANAKQLQLSIALRTRSNGNRCTVSCRRRRGRWLGLCGHTRGH